MDQKNVTFFSHEIVGADQTYNMMKRLKFGQDEIEYVVKLVRWHQFRFYSDSSDRTIAKWLKALGKTDWLHLIHLRLADRAGNLKNKDKPLWNAELKELVSRCKKIIKNKEVVFIEDLAVSRYELQGLGLSNKQLKQACTNLVSIIKLKPSRNNREYIMNFIQKNYITQENNDDCPGDSPPTT